MNPPTIAGANARGGSPFIVIPMPALDKRDPLWHLGNQSLPISPFTFGICTRSGGGGVNQ